MLHRSMLLIAIAAVAPQAQGAGLDHAPVGCVVADRYPRIEARFTPADSVGRARVFFSGDDSTSWYAVPMTRAGDTLTAFLPKPKKELPRFRYYVEVVDTAMTTSRTAEHTAGVAAAAAACAPDMMAAPSVATASVAGAAVATGAVGGGESEDEGEDAPTSLIQVRGVVYGRFGPNPSAPLGPGLYQPPIAGAVVSTSLDAATTVTDGNGRFHLVTQTPLRGCESFTLTITAGGWPTWTGTATFHNGDGGDEFTFSMIPPLPMTPFSGCAPR